MDPDEGAAGVLPSEVEALQAERNDMRASVRRAGLVPVRREAEMQRLWRRIGGMGMSKLIDEYEAKKKIYDFHKITSVYENICNKSCLYSFSRANFPYRKRYSAIIIGDCKRTSFGIY